MMIWVEVREKNFEMSLEFKICFERRLWVPEYPQKQTEWSCDTWIDFYGDKRMEVAISQNPPFENSVIWDLWAVKKLGSNYINFSNEKFALQPPIAWPENIFSWQYGYLKVSRGS